MVRNFLSFVSLVLFSLSWFIVSPEVTNRTEAEPRKMLTARRVYESHFGAGAVPQEMMGNVTVYRRPENFSCWESGSACWIYYENHIVAVFLFVLCISFFIILVLISRSARPGVAPVRIAIPRRQDYELHERRVAQA